MNNFNLLFCRYLNHYRGLPPCVWQQISLSLLAAIAAGVVYFLSIYFVDDLHYPIEMAGLLLAAYGLGTAIGGVLGGVLSDKFSPKRVAAGSLLLAGVCYALLIFLKTPCSLLSDLFLLGIALYIFRVANNTAALSDSSLTEDNRLKTITLLGASYNFGLAISGAIIGVFASMQFSDIFILMAVLLMIAILYLTCCVQAIPQTHVISKTEEVSAEESATNLKIKVLVFSLLFCFGLFVAQFTTTYPIYIKHHFAQGSMLGFSLLFIINALLVVFFQTPIVRVFQAANKIFIVGFGLFLYGIALWLLDIYPLYIIAIISCVTLTLGEILFYANAQYLVYQKTSARKKGKVLGIFQTIFAIGVIIGPWVGAKIYSTFSPEALWMVCGIIGIMVFLAGFFCRRWTG